MTLTKARPDELKVHDPKLGSASLHRLDWDTEFFGAVFGMVDSVKPDRDAAGGTQAHASLLQALVKTAAAAGYAHLTYRPPVEDWHAVHGAECAGFLLIDVGVDFVQRLTPPVAPILADLRPSCDDDLPTLRDLAGTAFVYSRFAVDPFFSPQQVEDFHRQWMTNLHNGLARTVLVSESDGVIQGFVACALDGRRGRIPLIGVDAASRGQGLGSTLVRSSLRWFYEAGAEEVRVKTQATNGPATLLYERCGFALERAELTFSKALR